jgi:hypothetical protein
MLKRRPRALALPKSHELTRLANPLSNPTHNRLRHSLIRTAPGPPLPRTHTTHARSASITSWRRPWSDVATAVTRSVLGAHAR